MMTIDDDAIEIKLNNSQALVQIINANTTYCMWPRGGGKTGGGIGPRIVHLNEVMPRSQIILFSDTYERLMDRIVPNICYFLEDKHGWIEGEDYVRYKRPPEDWVKPVIPLDKFDKVISTNTGLAICLVSLSVEGSANAYNAVSAIGDEVKYCDEEKIDAEVMPALRGMQDVYGHLPEYLSVWLFTDKYGPKVKWLLKKKKLMDIEAVECVYALQMEILRLEAEKEQFSQSVQAKYDKEIALYKEKADRIRKSLVYYSDMAPYENKEVLGDFFFKRARRIAGSEYVYNVAFLNHDPDKIEHSFYPTFSDYNKYSSRLFDDYNPASGLIIAMDFNWRIVPMIIAQTGLLPGHTQESVNITDFLYMLHPKGLDDCLALFCNRYKHITNRVIHFIFDQTVIGRKPTSKSYRDMVCEYLRNNDWTVVEHYIGKASDHDIRFERMKPWLLNRGYLRLMINKSTAGQLITSIEGAGAMTVGGVTKKDKRTETKLDFPAEDATHGSEAFDMLLWGVFEKRIHLNETGSFQDIVIQ